MPADRDDFNIQIVQLVRDVTSASVAQARSTEELRDLIANDLTQSLQVILDSVNAASETATHCATRETCSTRVIKEFGSTMTELQALVASVKTLLSFIKITFIVLGGILTLFGIYQVLKLSFAVKGVS